jgi:hypothetical protein
VYVVPLVRPVTFAEVEVKEVVTSVVLPVATPATKAVIRYFEIAAPLGVLSFQAKVAVPSVVNKIPPPEEIEVIVGAPGAAAVIVRVWITDDAAT